MGRIFIWDHTVFEPSWHPIGDTWVGLTTVALSTSRMNIGPLLTPLPRRRPWKLSREAVAVDQLSNGRLILGVGIGDPVIVECHGAYERAYPKGTTSSTEHNGGITIWARKNS
jgi:alkanesulfonate monooxygenase SsuD/methylene tetrahydromethanopterin reductase-like flavin-dependent oxidoreductase (luciferase family)